jgi:hypothetical protein
MALRLIRRHLKDCPHTSTRYRRCRCPIHVYGTLAGEKIRKALDQTSWDAASDLITAWTAAGEIGVVKAEVPTVPEAVGKYIADCEARKLGWEAMRKYRHLLEDRFLPWAEHRGLRTIKQVSVDGLRQFRQTWTDSSNYATKNLERLRAFFRFCHQAGWIKDNPAKAVKPPKVTQTPTLPFSRDEMMRIVKACDEYGGNRARMKAFVLTMRYTGLRIGDASVERALWRGCSDCPQQSIRLSTMQRRLVRMLDSCRATQIANPTVSTRDRAGENSADFSEALRDLGPLLSTTMP